jgi:hypothetical protein
MYAGVLGALSCSARFLFAASHTAHAHSTRLTTGSALMCLKVGQRRRCLNAGHILCDGVAPKCCAAGAR